MLVVGFAHVEQSDELAVDEVEHGLIALAIDVERCAGDDGLKSWVLESTVVVVSSVANLERLVTEERFVAEETVWEVFDATLVGFLCGEFEGVGCPSTAPSSTSADVAFLTEQDVAVGIEILKIDRTVPIHVPVALVGIAIARTTVHALHEDAERVAVEVGIVANHGNDGEGVAIVLLQIGTRDDRTWQHAILVETETQHGIVRHGEQSVSGTGTVGEGRGAAVSGVAQCATCWDGDFRCEIALEKRRRVRNDGSIQTLCGKVALGIGGARSGIGGEAPFVATIRGAGIGNARDGFGIRLGQKHIALDVGNVDGSSIAIELESHLRLGVLGKMVEPDGSVTMSRHVGSGVVDEVEASVFGVVADVAIPQTEPFVGRVVDFYPSSKIEGRVHKHIYIG